jgi:hypothetical protein
MTARPNRPEPADLEFTASVEAKELYFREVPDTSVVFTGEPGHQSASGSDRTNLPDQVRKEVSYRDVRVNYRIACRVIEPPPEAPCSRR